jgi:hypothetical protein
MLTQFAAAYKHDEKIMCSIMNWYGLVTEWS